MSLSDLASLGSFVSGVAVLVSLVYLALQVRQAAKHSRAIITQQRITRIVDILFRTNDPVLAQIILKAETAPHDMSRDEFFRYLNSEWARFLNAEDTFLQHRSGLLDERAFTSFVLNNQRVMRNTSTRRAWKILRPRFNSAYGQFMDGMLTQSEPQVPDDQYAQWLALASPRAETPAAKT